MLRFNFFLSFLILAFPQLNSSLYAVLIFIYYIDFLIYQSGGETRGVARSFGSFLSRMHAKFHHREFS